MEYEFEIKFENWYWGKSFERVRTKAKSEQEARNDLSQYLISSNIFPDEIILLK
jgi:hypothetical protein